MQTLPQYWVDIFETKIVNLEINVSLEFFSFFQVPCQEIKGQFLSKSVSFDFKPILSLIMSASIFPRPLMQSTVCQTCFL